MALYVPSVCSFTPSRTIVPSINEFLTSNVCNTKLPETDMIKKNMF